MTEERKQELRQLLQKAMKGLQIGIRFGGDYLVIPVVDWKKLLTATLDILWRRFFICVDVP